MQFKSFLTNLYPFRLSKSLLSSSFSNVRFVPTKFPWATCLLEDLVSSFSQPVHLSYTLHTNERYPQFTCSASFLSEFGLFVCFVHCKIKTWRNSCLVAWCCWETVFTQLEESIYIPSDLSRFCLSNPQWAQLIESRHGPASWVSVTTKFHTRRDVESSN